MKLPLIVSPEAEQDMAEAARRYECQRPGLGRDFLRSVDAAMAQIRRMPSVLPKVFEDLRRAPTGRFPYGIFYKVGPERITVIAVYHNSRDPRGWQKRA